MAKNSGLGRGLDSLIPKDLDASILEEDLSRVQKILISDIKPNPSQPRREINQNSLNELASSIKRHGLLQPIIVVRDKSQNAYRIVAGERRWRAAAQAGLEQIPAIIRSLEELEEIELALVENIQREDLSPLEQALSVFKLQHQFNLSLEKIAEKLGKAPSTVSNIARLLQLPDEARRSLEEGKISEGHARAILALKWSTKKQEELLRYILNNNWTVRQAEQFVTASKSGADSRQAKAHTASESILTKNLSQRLQAPVSIRHTARGGQLLIGFKNQKDLEKLTKKLNELNEPN